MGLIRIQVSSVTLTFTTWEYEAIKRAFMVAAENACEPIIIHYSTQELTPHYWPMTIEGLASMASELDLIDAYCWFDNAIQRAERSVNGDVNIPKWRAAMRFIEELSA